MINNIIRFSVYRPLVIIITTAFIAIFGWICFQNLPIDAVPDVTNNQVQINSALTGLSTEEAFPAITESYSAGESRAISESAVSCVITVVSGNCAFAPSAINRNRKNKKAVPR